MYVTFIDCSIHVETVQQLGSVLFTIMNLMKGGKGGEKKRLEEATSTATVQMIWTTWKMLRKNKKLDLSGGSKKAESVLII